MISAPQTEEMQWGQIVARAWADQSFKNRLLSDPTVVLREFGVELAPGTQARVVEGTDRAFENSDRVRHFVLPSSPAAELAEEDLSPTPADNGYCGYCHRCGYCGRCGCGCDRY